MKCNRTLVIFFALSMGCIINYMCTAVLNQSQLVLYLIVLVLTIAASQTIVV
jgi:hypothetical protein